MCLRIGEIDCAGQTGDWEKVKALPEGTPLRSAFETARLNFQEGDSCSSIEYIDTLSYWPFSH